ncbi:uncharacterized protein PAC_18635 [Phialocephala subalpina]|uniref:Uncharacterized protein n=1 Tax=Phialocephala subalpina TaxID=576137 RepID=A0A1L7XUP2_9HELO|nr:uncharacterized protein PAC_18635 [Phialocephala subalpina]
MPIGETDIQISKMQLLTIFSTLATSAHLHQRTAAATSALTTLTGTHTSIATSTVTNPASPSTSTGTSSCDPNTPYADCTASKTFTPPTAHFSPIIPATLRVDAAEAEALLSAFSSVDSTWTAGPQYPGLKTAVFEAAPTTAQLSLAANGYNWDAIVRSDWYTSIPVNWQSVIVGQEKALESVFENITGSHVPSSGAEGSLRERARKEAVILMAGLIAIVAAFVGMW